jgi:hypothetical protein
MQSIDSTLTSRASTLVAITRPVGASIELRAIKDDKVVGRSFCRTRRAVEDFCARYSWANIYFGPAIRKADANDGTLDSCQHLAAVFSDIDFKNTPLAAAQTALSAFPLLPSIIILSGGGWHLYWLLSELLKLPEGAARAKALLRKLAIALKGDIYSAEPVHLLRVPGTRNYKYEPVRFVSVEKLNGTTYELSEFDAALANVVDVANTGTAVTTRSIPQHTSIQTHPRLDMGLIAAGLPDGRRDFELFRLACWLRRRGYSRERTREVVLDAASRCCPPFPAPLAEQKVSSAWRYV